MRNWFSAKSKGFSIGTGALLFVVFLVSSAPAQWLAWELPRLTQGTVFLQNASGTVWHGRGRLSVFNGTHDHKETLDTDWRLAPAALFWGALKAHVHGVGDAISGQGWVIFQKQHMVLVNVQADARPDLVAWVYPEASTIGLDGRLHLDIAKLDMKDRQMQGAGDLLWSNAACNLTSVEPLGDYRLHVDAQGSTAALILNTTRGDLHLQGKGEWNFASTGLVHVEGLAQASGQRQALEPLLQLLGPVDGQGAYPFVLNL